MVLDYREIKNTALRNSLENMSFLEINSLTLLRKTKQNKTPDG